MVGAPVQTELRLTPPPAERSLEFVILQALADPGVVRCPICRGRTQEVPGGVECFECGSQIVRDDSENSQTADAEGVMFLEHVAR